MAGARHYGWQHANRKRAPHPVWQTAEAGKVRCRLYASPPGLCKSSPQALNSCGRAHAQLADQGHACEHGAATTHSAAIGTTGQAEPGQATRQEACVIKLLEVPVQARQTDETHSDKSSAAAAVYASQHGFARYSDEPAEYNGRLAGKVIDSPNQAGCNAECTAGDMHLSTSIRIRYHVQV